MSFFHATCKAQSVGDGTVGQLISWLGRYVNVLFPDNGIEYFAARDGLGREQPVPTAGCAGANVHHVACYVRGGSNEGRIIEVALYLREDGYVSITWIKTFGSSDECWTIARAIEEALTSLIFWGEKPEIVEMADKLPRATWSNRVTSLEDEVVVLSSPDAILVSTSKGQVFDARSWADKEPHARGYVEAVEKDWVTVLTNTKAQFRVIKNAHRTFLVPDLPGYLFSNRGVDGITGLYVLKPGGNPNDDRDYLGYYPSVDAAITAASEHRCHCAARVG